MKSFKTIKITGLDIKRKIKGLCYPKNRRWYRQRETQQNRGGRMEIMTGEKGE